MEFAQDPLKDKLTKTGSRLLDNIAAVGPFSDPLPNPLDGMGSLAVLGVTNLPTWQDKIPEDLQSEWFKGIEKLEEVLDGTRVIGEGAAGEYVKRLQEALDYKWFKEKMGIDETQVEWRIDLGAAGVDGIYGDNTRKSLLQFQRYMNEKFQFELEEDGELGRETLYVLDAIFKHRPYPPLEGGSSGYLQYDPLGRLQEQIERWTNNELTDDDMAITIVYSEESTLKRLTGEQRLAVILGMLDEDVPGKEEEAILQLLATCPVEQIRTLVSGLSANEGQGFLALEDSMHGENYKALHIMYLTLMYEQLGPQGYYEQAISVATINGVELPGDAKEMPWKDTQFSGYTAYTFRFSGGEQVKLTYAPYNALNEAGAISDPYYFRNAFSPVLLNVMEDEPALGVNGAKGTQLLVPVINIKMLQHEQLKDSSFAALAALSMVTGVGAIGVAANAFKVIIASLDVLLGAASLYVEENRLQLSQDYPELIAVWDNFNMVLGVYGLARVVYELPQMAIALYQGLGRVKGNAALKFKDFRAKLGEAIEEAKKDKANSTPTSSQPAEEFSGINPNRQSNLQLPSSTPASTASRLGVELNDLVPMPNTTRVYKPRLRRDMPAEEARFGEKVALDRDDDFILSLKENEPGIDGFFRSSGNPVQLKTLTSAPHNQPRNVVSRANTAYKNSINSNWRNLEVHIEAMGTTKSEVLGRWTRPNIQPPVKLKNDGRIKVVRVYCQDGIINLPLEL